MYHLICIQWNVNDVCDLRCVGAPVCEFYVSVWYLFSHVARAHMSTMGSNVPLKGGGNRLERTFFLHTLIFLIFIRSLRWKRTRFLTLIWSCEIGINETLQYTGVFFFLDYTYNAHQFTMCNNRRVRRLQSRWSLLNAIVGMKPFKAAFLYQ